MQKDDYPTSRDVRRAELISIAWYAACACGMALLMWGAYRLVAYVWPWLMG
jgi:hypothetical protein